jgi:hypothetical protein
MLPSTSPPPAPAAPSRRGPVALAIVLAVVLAGAVVALALRDGGDGGGGVGVGPWATVAPARQGVFDELMAQVAEVRGLEWTGPLDLKVVPKDELVELVRESFTEDTDEAEVEAVEATLKLLGLLPADLDYGRLIEDLLAEQVLGYYDPKTRELFVGGEGGDTGAFDVATRLVIVHEMVHALTDQVFNFGPATIALDEQDRTEELTAYSSLLEGDAVLTTELWAERHLTSTERLSAALGGGGDISTFLRAPEYVRQSLFFPYREGLEFVRGLHRAGGFAAVDAAYANPPTSTEHILRPATYQAGQQPSPPPMPDLAAATGCAQVYTGVVGQFDMRAVLDTHLTLADADRAVEGWNGDALSVVRCGNSLGLANRWATDPGTDPARLVEALGRWARQWSGGGQGPTADGRFTGPRGSGRVVRAGPNVELVLAQDASTRDLLVRALSPS